MAKKIEFQDFSKSVTTEEFLAVFHIIEGVNDNFNKAVESRKRKIQESKENMKTLLDTHGRFGIPYLEAKAIHAGFVEVLTEDISGGFKKFLTNYDGTIEFLRRFSICDTIKKQNIRSFIKEDKDGK